MQVLRVYPNPFIAFDKNGTPCGLCPRDPEADAGGPGLFVGARVDRKNTRVLQDFGKMAAHELRSARQQTLYEYLGVASTDPELADKLGQKEPIELPVTKYYRDRLIEGSIIPADADTARAARIKHFTPPVQFFALQKPKSAEPPAESAELPGELTEPLPQSPDADGNVLEAPATDGAERVEAVSAFVDAGGPAVDLSAELTSPTTKNRKQRNEG